MFIANTLRLAISIVNKRFLHAERKLPARREGYGLRDSGGGVRVREIHSTGNRGLTFLPSSRSRGQTIALDGSSQRVNDAMV